MSDNSSIEWTEATWNPVTGCTKVSPGCDHCYAETLSKRWGRSFEVTLHPDRLAMPLTWKKPKLVFANSMSDLFHVDVPDDFLREVWDVMVETPQHTYQVLTKRTHRMVHKIRELELEITPNLWLGTSVENQKFADNRCPALLAANLEPAVRWLSCEPLLGPLDLALHLPFLDWVVVGGESGTGRREMDKEWARQIRDDCAAEGVPFFFKQGNHFRAGHDRVLDDREHNDMPRGAKVGTA